MKRLLISLLFLSPAAWGACAGSNPNWTSTIDQASVQACANNAGNGSTITVGSGTATWTSSVSWSGKGLKFIGATVCTGGKTGTCTDNTDITVNTSSANAFVVNGASGTNFNEITGFTLREVTASGNGIIEVDGTAAAQNSFRVHHNHIVANSGPSRGIIPNNVFGLIDNNKFDGTAGGSIQFISVQGSGPGTDGGYTPWMISNTLGTNNNIFIEYNSFTSNSPESVIDCYTGGHLVIRNNGFHNSNWGFHGTDSGNNRSCAYFEIYNNDFDNSGSAIRIGNTRGGTGVIYNNHILSGSYTGVALQLYRACPRDGSDTSGWGTLNGTNYAVGSASFSAQASRNTHTTTGAASATNVLFCSLDRDAVCTADSQCSSVGKGTCSAFFDGTGTNGYPGRDQPGVGHGQALEPIYAWNNDFSLGADDGPGTCSPSNKVSGTLVVLNRDYFTGSTPKPGYVAFTNPHPLEGGGSGLLIDTSSPLPGGVVGSAYSQTLSASGGTTPYTWTITSGTLPSGLSLASSTGIISGTPSGAGASSVVVRVTDATTAAASKTLSITIAANLTTKYLDNSGASGCSDTAGQDGSEAHPFCTYDYAISRLSGGDTLYIKNGIYDNGSSVTGPSGISADHTVISAYPGHAPVFKNTTGHTASGSMQFVGVSYFDILGLTITDINQGIQINGSDHILVQNNTIFSIGQEAYHVKNGSSFVSILNNVGHDTGLNLASDGECAYVGTGTGPDDDTNNVTVKDNTFFNCSSEGIEIKPGTHDNIVDNNDVSRTGTNINGFGCNAIEIDEAVADSQIQPTNPNQIVRNNKVHDIPTCSGIRLGTGVTAYNNVVWNITTTSQRGIFTDNANNDSYVRKIYNNTVDLPTARAIVITGGTADVQNNIGPNAAGNVAVNSAFFTNYASHDYRLVSGTAAVGSGSNLLSTVTVDILGVARLLPFDMGAYAFTGNKVPAPATGLLLTISKLKMPKFLEAQ